MNNSKTKGGVHVVDTANPAPVGREVRLLRQKDASYLLSKHQHANAELNRHLEEISLLNASNTNINTPRRHIHFVEDQKEMKQFEIEQVMDTPKELIGRAHDRKSKRLLEETDIQEVPVEKKQRKLQISLQRVVEADERAALISKRLKHYEELKNLHGKGPRRKVSQKQPDGSLKSQWLWKAVRKR
jgi:hypothetical protein